MTLFMCVFVLSWGFELQDFRIGSAVGGMTSHREGGLIAVSSDDWIVRIIDSESRSVVREVRGFVFCFIIFLIGRKVCWSFQSNHGHVFQWRLQVAGNCVGRLYDSHLGHCVWGLH